MFLVELSDGHHKTEDELTYSSSFHLLRRDSKHRQHLGHNLRHYIRYRCSRRDFGMNLEAGEEAFDPVEEFDKNLATRRSILCRLWEMCYHSLRGDILKLTTRRIPIPEKMILVGGNT
jgi:hypothetical protein